MTAMTRLHRLWRNLVHRGRVERDLDAELHAALTLLVEEKLRAGALLPEARRAARLELGALEAVKDNVRDGRAGHTIETLVQDVRFALRSLQRSPGFAAVALVTLALCTGANAAVFSIVNGVLLRPLPYPAAERLVRVFQSNPRIPQRGILEGAASFPDLEDWRARSRAFEAIAGSMSPPQILIGRGEPTEIESAYVTDDFFQVLGTPAAAGRPLGADDSRLAKRNVVISDRLWRNFFGADPAAIGQAIQLRGDTFTIVGIMPSDFRYPAPETDVWIAHSVLTERDVGPRDRQNRFLAVVARLKPDVTLAQARDDLNRITAQLAREYPQTNRQWETASVVPLRTTLVGDVNRALTIVLIVVAFVLLIGCANLANLLLARTAARSREVAIRAAIGAGRARIARQFLTESFVLAIIGVALGSGLAYWGVPAILALSAHTLPRVQDVQLDLRVAGFVVLVVLVTAILCGIFPAKHASRVDVHEELRGHGAAHPSDRRLRNGLVVAEVSLAVLLVIGAGLMIRSLLALRGVDPGFDPDHVLTVRLQWNLANVPPSEIGNRLVQRRNELIARMKALPGVVDAGTTVSLPLQGQCLDYFDFFRGDGSGGPDGTSLRGNNCLVSSSYLSTLRIPLLRGEELPADLPSAGAPLPLLVNEAAARRFWPGQDAVGQHLRFPPSFPLRDAAVVGIVRNVRQLGLAADPPPLFYADQRIGPRLLTTLVVRTAGDPLLLTGAIRQAVHDLDPNQPIRSIETLRAVMAESIARDRFFTLLLGVFGGLALVLAAVGIYGVLAYTVTRRTNEIGVRMALGAGTADVLGSVLGGGMRLVALGIALGIAMSFGMSRVLASQLFGVTTTDPAALSSAVTILTCVGLMACLVPAWKATRISPMTALRSE